MANRPSWRGFLRWSLVSVPVQAVNSAESGGGQFHLNQLHATCHSRIKYQKVCPTHGEVSNEEIVSGYEYSPGEYVIVDPAELSQLRSPSDKAIQIGKFLPPEAVDPIFFSGDTYYLLPDGEAGVKPYSVLFATMEHENRVTIGQVVFSGKERLVMLRPVEGVLSMSMLKYENELRQPKDVAAQLKKTSVTKEEMRLADMLLKASLSDRFNIADYPDLYTERMQKLIDAKVAGEEIVQAPDEQEPQVINLMDALRESVAKAGKTHRASSPAKKSIPIKKVSPAQRDPGRTSRRAKTG